LHYVHYQAWKKGVKSLYYCRSLSIQRAEKEDADAPVAAPSGAVSDYEECLSCQ
jgi:ribonucleoside-diphosphate reductase alpha chain